MNNFVAGSDHAVLCLNTSRANHSCRPNVLHTYASGYMRFSAVRDIKKNEEILTCYESPVLPFDKRQHELQKLYKFECRCERCSAELQSDDVRKRNDALVLRFLKLQDLAEQVQTSSFLPGTTGLVNTWPGASPGLVKTTEEMLEILEKLDVRGGVSFFSPELVALRRAHHVPSKKKNLSY